MHKADTILINGVICTVDPAFRFVQALVVDGGRILYCGNTSQALKYRGEETKIIDLEGKLVLPGTFDAHIHAAFAGLSLSPDFVKVEPEDACNLKEFNERIREKAEKLPEDTWIIGWGFKTWQVEEWAKEDRLPTWKDIEEGSMGHPVILNDGGLHTMLVSRRALELAGITKDTVFKKEEGTMFRFEDGSPTGLFTDFGTQAAVGRAAHHLVGDEMDECLMRMQRQMNSYGITSHNDIVGIGGNDMCFGTYGEEAIHGYERLRRSGKLTARVFVNILAGKGGVQSYDTIFEGIGEMRLPEFGDKEWVRADAVKVFGDDGWERDLPPGQNGYCMFPGETPEEQGKELAKTLKELHHRGWQTATHLTGGRGIDVAVDALSEAEEEEPGRDLRHFILHASGSSRENIKKCVRHGIGCGAQAVGGYEFGGETDYKVLLDGGMLVAEGSDAPALPMNWMKGLHFLVSRKAKDGKVYHPEMAIDIREAVRMYTIYPAWQNHAEDFCGSLEVGKCADLQVLERNIFEIPADEIEHVRVLMTMCGGKIVYRDCIDL
ncbi:amidohydrolase [[Clostridium] symbiosum]|uniref:amidohydrolase n=1 Tax=Clostridium symbiosum TaxID=1512 RepID=UPI001D07F711|nr:amidohydrolase [[Clostridium] symbiosum]MCB6608300.1 amidohydrolase [[Clostridium] symbiosum]MCB6932850.1 amidohydrolase [[Clostridium] symbiosum]